MMYGLIYNLRFCILLLLTILGLAVKAQLRDTLINVGNHSLHFTIMEGKGIPIVLESGAGTDGSVWRKLLEPLSSKLGAPLITYDRAGFGKKAISRTAHGKMISSSPCLPKNGIPYCDLPKSKLQCSMFEPIGIRKYTQFRSALAFQKRDKLQLVTIRIIKVNGQGWHPRKDHRCFDPIL